jgi:hypothetical protein
MVDQYNTIHPEQSELARICSENCKKVQALDTVIVKVLNRAG